MSYKITIEIETGNAAFEGDLEGPEVASILEIAARRFKVMGAMQCDGTPLADSNGNRVGVIKVQPIEAPSIEAQSI